MPEKKDKRVKITVVEDDDTPSETELTQEQVPDETPPEEKPKVQIISDEPEEIKEKDQEEETPAEAIEEELHKEEKEAEILSQKPETAKPDDEEQVVSEYKQQKEKIPFWILFLAFLIGLSLGAGLIGGIFFYKSRVEGMDLTSGTSKPESTITPQESVNEPPLPESSPASAEKTDLTKVNVQILNGSGIAGEAGRVDALLKKAGFTKTVTGNASTYNFTKTTVSIKKDAPADVYLAIEKALSTYVLEKNENLSSSSSYTVVITVGKDKSSN